MEKISDSIESNSKTEDVSKQYSTQSSQIKSGRWNEFVDTFRRQRPEDLKYEKDEEEAEGTQLKKGLKQRQLQMIALGGCVGSGLLVASGQALENGPASLLIAWAIVSSFLYCVMQSLAELAALFPVSGSFATFSTRFVDESWGFAIGWNYALFWVIVLPLELVASSLTINFWPSNINSVAWVAIFYVLIILLNLSGNKGFGEFEFIASIIKLLAIVGFNILAIILICGGGEQGYIGAKYWHDPGAFTTGAKGVISVLITATYSLAGTELVGLTASEADGNPRIVLPNAIKQVLWRIVIFYMLTLTLIGFLVPANSPDLIGASSDASASPFVIAIRAGGIKVLPSIFNVVVLIALLSIGNSSVYGFTRTLVALGEQGLAPKICAYVDRRGRPLFGIAVSAVFGLLAFVSASSKEAEVFDWLVALSGLSTLFTWFSISLSHFRFRMALKAQGRDTSEIPYVALTGVWGDIYSMVMLVAILGLQFWLALFPLGASPNAAAFFEDYLGAVVVLVFFLGHKLYTRKFSSLVPLATMDIDTGRTEKDVDLLKQEVAEERQLFAIKPWYAKVYHFLF